MTKCNAAMEFGDDYGDNSCTFHCGLGKDHNGPHMETGNLYGQKYTVTWEDPAKAE